MPKQIAIEPIGQVTIAKRRGQKSIRLSITHGSVRVSQPSWLPYSAGEAFARSRRDWIMQHISTTVNHIKPGNRAGLSRQIVFEQSDQSTAPRHHIDATSFTVTHPSDLHYTDPSVQSYTRKVLDKHLRQEAEIYLPKRVRTLSEIYGFTYHSVQVKKLTRRWGSCSSKGDLTFNLSLMMLDPLHIDYVILHELTHTLHMDHSKQFWDHLESVFPKARAVAKIVRRVNP